MPLLEYLKIKNKTQAKFASEIGVKAMSVNNYCHGNRTPSPEIMERIFQATNGRVAPNDFHNLIINGGQND